ncbi:MAG: RNA methyltransferase [Betaproteobacteria bacterium]|nr:RNA methyltransferase [Betaproteobacteria bacterium]
MDDFRIIRSRDNPVIKELRKLASSSRERRRTGSAIFDGKHLVEAVRDAGLCASTLVTSESALLKPDIRALFLGTPAVCRIVLDDRLIADISQVVTATGLMAVMQIPDAGPLPDDAQDCILLENIQDPGNLGSIFRTAAAADVRRIMLSSTSVFAWSPKVLRAGMGAHFRLAIHENVDLEAYAGRFSGKVISTASLAESSIFDVNLDGPVAWVFGNEGAGLSAALLGRAVSQARIPMPGGTESLNVAAAVAVCIFEKLRRGANTSARQKFAIPAPAHDGTRPVQQER